MTESILDAVADSVRLLPFLFFTYLVMEWLEHKTGNAARRIVERSGRFGPLFGAVLGAFPQCGFSAAGSGLYAGRVITLGTLYAIYLSTSDEMIPIMLSEAAPLSLIGGIIVCKIVIGLTVGTAVDMVLRTYDKGKEGKPIGEMCSREQCHCGKDIVKSALRHTFRVTFFIFLITLGLNLFLNRIGSGALSNVFLRYGVLGEMTAGLIGLIPNCASSVMITKLYLEGVIDFGAVLSGLLAGSGIGLLVLYRVNRRWKENVCITVGLYAVSVACGMIANAAGLTIT